MGAKFNRGALGPSTAHNWGELDMIGSSAEALSCGLRRLNVCAAGEVAKRGQALPAKASASRLPSLQKPHKHTVWSSHNASGPSLVPPLLATKPLNLDHASMQPRRREPCDTRSQPDSLLPLQTSGTIWSPIWAPLVASYLALPASQRAIPPQASSLASAERYNTS